MDESSKQFQEKSQDEASKKIPKKSQDNFQDILLEEVPGESKEGQLEEVSEEFPVEHIAIVEIRPESHEKSQKGPLEEILEEPRNEPHAEQKSDIENQNQTRVQDMILTPWGIIIGCLVGFLAVAWALFGVYSKEFLVYLVFLFLVFCPGY